MRAKTKIYKERDTCALDEAGGFFALHMDAMTREGLEGKFEIAAELAHRDAEIARLECANAKLNYQVAKALAYAKKHGLPTDFPL